MPTLILLIKKAANVIFNCRCSAEPVVPESRYNDWRYWNGVLNIAMLRLGEVLKEPTYTEFAVEMSHLVSTIMPILKNDMLMKINGNTLLVSFL